LSRVLRIDFATAEIFHREHTANLANGGVFVACRDTDGYSLRDIVTVELALAFCNQKVALEGEVVHIVPPEMAGAGAEPGIAVQFLGSTIELARRLEPLVTACGSLPRPEPRDPGRRASPRVAARVPVRVHGDAAAAQGVTRNLSQTGVLVAVGGSGIAPGQKVHVTLEHPITGEEMEVTGRVVREIATGGDVAALGIEFHPPKDFREDVSRFVEQVQSAEHTRRLGGISGRIEELGPQNLLQMLGSAAPQGTLLLRHGDLEGEVGFESQMLCYARLGSAAGVKALVRMLSWETGSFEFFARLEKDAPRDAPLPLEAAIFEAMRGIDESRRIDRGRLPLQAQVVVVDDADWEAVPHDPLNKIEGAVLDLARVGFTVERIIDVIPEADPDILRALDALADRGIIRFDN
jgi:Tfp pilus assembly protein PilZ